MTPHRLPIRVYYEDTDFSCNVYHAAYLHFFERGRTEFLRDLGVHHSELVKDGIAFAVKSMQTDFIAAAHIDDLLEVTTEVLRANSFRPDALGDELMTFGEKFQHRVLMEPSWTGADV